MQNNNKKLDTLLPFILLILVGLFIFFTENHDGGTIDGSLYGSNSAHGITLAKNLMNNEHPLFMFVGKEISNGKVVYDAYNRFPVFPFLVIGFFIAPFWHHLTFEIYIARQIMNVFFFLSIIMAFKLVYELIKDKYIALLVVLVIFSSYYILTYNDMIFNDIPALLGFVVALYCVVKAQKAKLKISHVIFYSLFPISLGWQPYAVYIAWFVIDTIDLMLKKDIHFKKKTSALIKQQSLKILAIAFTWGVLILGLQLFNEWRIIGGSFTSLPSVSSGLWRTGLSSAAGHTQFTWTFNWLNYLPSQCHAITLMLIPFWPIFQVEPGINASIFIVVAFIIYILIRYLKNKESINKIYLIMVFSGLFWTIPMRHFVALHDFQSIFYIGFVLSIYSILFSRISPRTRKLLTIDITIVFLISVSLSNHLKSSNSSSLTTSFKNINKQLPENSKVFFDENRQRLKGFSEFAIDFFLSDCWFTTINEADYVISRNPDFKGKKLTSNTGFNLYELSKDK